MSALLIILINVSRAAFLSSIKDAGKRRIYTAGSARLATTRRHAKRVNYLHRRPVSAGDPAALSREAAFRVQNRRTGREKQRKRTTFRTLTSVAARAVVIRGLVFAKTIEPFRRSRSLPCRVCVRACVVPTIALIDGGNEQVERHFLVPTERGRSRDAVRGPIAQRAIESRFNRHELMIKVGSLPSQ